LPILATGTPEGPRAPSGSHFAPVGRQAIPPAPHAIAIIPPMHDADPIPSLKQQLAAELVTRLDGWRLDYAADFIGTTFARVSNLRNGRLDQFSLERLIRFIARDHGEVTVQVKWKSRWARARSMS
jgi:predicted XRE-type DNA-binding protein